MKFGVALFGVHPKDRPSPVNFQEVLELTRAARDAGFDLVHAGHHFMVKDFQKFQVIPAMARVAAESGDMLLSILDLITLNHPVRIAEEIATLDAITNGRIVFIPTMGYVDHDFTTFGVDKSKRRRIYLEAIEIVKLLWTEEVVNFEGEFFTITDTSINPRTIQAPRPPIWQPADAVAGIKRAASTGDAWLISSHHTINDIKDQMEIYRGARPAAPEEFNSHGITLPLMRVGCVADTKERAEAVGRPYVSDMWETYYAQMGQAAEMDDPDDFLQSYEELRRDRFIFGTPDEALEEFKKYESELGVDLIMLDPAGTHADKVRTMELIGKHIIPEMRR